MSDQDNKPTFYLTLDKHLEIALAALEVLAFAANHTSSSLMMAVHVMAKRDPETFKKLQSLFIGITAETPPVGTPANENVIEVHNCWAIYGVEANGEATERSVAEFHRPQDWGHPRWTYHRFDFDWLTSPDGKIFRNHAHCWTDLRLPIHEYPELFAPLVAQIMMPGHPEALCGKDFLHEDDFWLDEWGPMPPFYYVASASDLGGFSDLPFTEVLDDQD